jgi:hypothetical protein
MSDKMAVVDDLRPTSPKQLQSSEGTLIIEYTPSIARPNLPTSEQSYKGKVKTHKYINRQNQSTTGKL